MILIALALLCVAAVPLTGGRLSRIAQLDVRWGAVAWAALVLQVLITTLLPGGSPMLHQALHLLSYAGAAAFIAVNRRIRGLGLLALGAASNALAIVANGGVMPASERAVRWAGVAVDANFANSAPVAHPHLLVLGDVLPVPGPWPLGNVLSVGDLLVVAGLFVVLHHASRPRRLAPGPVVPAT